MDKVGHIHSFTMSNLWFNAVLCGTSLFQGFNMATLQRKPKPGNSVVGNPYNMFYEKQKSADLFDQKYN